jgi:hypothetical protein
MIATILSTFTEKSKAVSPTLNFEDGVIFVVKAEGPGEPEGESSATHMGNLTTSGINIVGAVELSPGKEQSVC